MRVFLVGFEYRPIYKLVTKLSIIFKLKHYLYQLIKNNRLAYKREMLFQDIYHGDPYICLEKSQVYYVTRFTAWFYCYVTCFTAFLKSRYFQDGKEVSIS